MRTLITLSLFLAMATAGILPAEQQNVSLHPLKETEGRITATPGSLPYQVGLILDVETSSGLCGGTLISETWVLTSASCIYNIEEGLTVILGAFDIKNDNEKGQQRIYTPKSNLFVHNNYDPKNVVDNIGLIKLPIEVEFNEFIQPAALPKMDGKYSTYEGELAYVSGWGRESDSVSQYLQYTEVRVMKESSCKIYYFGLDTKEMICAKGKKSTCNVDSGGPLVLKDGDVNTVIGITSFSVAFVCKIGWPTAFVRVTSYLDWIEENTGIVNK